MKKRGEVLRYMLEETLNKFNHIIHYSEKLEELSFSNNIRNITLKESKDFIAKIETELEETFNDPYLEIIENLCKE